MARKKKSKRRDDDEDDLPDDPSDEVESLSDDDDPVVRRKPKDDAWTGLLAIALLALIGASVLFYLDHAALTAQTVAPPSFTLPGLGGVAAPQPG